MINVKGPKKARLERAPEDQAEDQDPDAEAPRKEKPAATAVMDNFEEQ